MVQLRVTAIPEVAIHQSSGFSRFTDRLDIPGLGKGLRLRFRLVNTRQAREAEARSGYRVPGTPYLTAGANSGKSGRARREQALRLMGMRPARLEPLALRASGHERMVNGRAAASGEKRIELSETIAWFGDILYRDGPLVEIGLCSVFNNSAIDRCQAGKFWPRTCDWEGSVEVSPGVSTTSPRSASWYSKPLIYPGQWCLAQSSLAQSSQR